MKQTLLVVTSIALSVPAASGQPSLEVPSFEVASVKPAAPNGPAAGMPFLNGPAGEQMRFRGGPDQAEKLPAGN